VKKRCFDRGQPLTGRKGGGKQHYSALPIAEKRREGSGGRRSKNMCVLTRTARVLAVSGRLRDVEKGKETLAGGGAKIDRVTKKRRLSSEETRFVLDRKKT